MTEFIDFLLHSDRHLLEFVQAHGPWIYALLFAIVFAETGFVVTPFLPGDSLLFAVGTLAATGSLDPYVSIALLFTAAFTGNAVNYAIGRRVGPRIFQATDTSGWSHKLLNREHLNKAHAFFEQYGGKAIVLGRFVPIVRTFVPFVAGVAEMSYRSFALYNVTGGIAWVAICLGAGYVFGNVPVVKENFSLVALGIVFVSLLPMVFEYVRYRRASSSPPPRSA